MKVRSYKFEFVADNFSNTGLSGFLEDSYLHTSTPIDLRGLTLFNFNVINVPGSWDPNRFRIVFKQSAVLPVTFNTVNAKVDMGVDNNQIVIYPNPVVNNEISMQFDNQPAGEYSIQLFNSMENYYFLKK